MISIFTKLKTTLLFVNKLIFIVLACYYIYNYKTYAVSINWLFLKKIYIIGSLINGMESLGLILLIIPLTVVVISFFFSEIKSIQLLSAFFSASGNIFSVAHGISQGLLEEKFKFGFLAIFHEVSLEKKQKAFQLLFDENIRAYALKTTEPAEFSKYVQTIVTKNWLDYLESLKAMTQDNVETYVNKLTLNLYNLYLQQITNAHTPNVAEVSSWWDKINPGAVKVIIVIAIGVVIYYFYNKLWKNAELTKDLASNQTELGHSQTEAVRLNMVSDNVIHDNATAILNNATSIDDLRSVLGDINTRLTKCCDSEQELRECIIHLKTVFGSQFEGLNTLRKHLDAVSKPINATSPDISYVELSLRKIDNLLQQNNQFFDVSQILVARHSELVSVITNLRQDFMVLTEEMLKMNAQYVEHINALQQKIEYPSIVSQRESAQLAANAADGRLLKEASERVLNWNSDQVVSDIKRQAMGKIKSLEDTTKKEIQDNLGELRAIKTQCKTLRDQTINTSKDNNEKISQLQNEMTHLKENHTAFQTEVKSTLESYRDIFETIKGDIIQEVKKYKPNFGLGAAFSMVRNISADNTQINSNNNNNISNMPSSPVVLPSAPAATNMPDNHSDNTSSASIYESEPEEGIIQPNLSSYESEPEEDNIHKNLSELLESSDDDEYKVYKGQQPYGDWVKFE